MLEKIGLPAKPSLRGNNWVVDSSHCQGCSSQFTFINRKHHCRRCGGLFCNSCTQQRMVLRGQGDSPVRICEPCKKLEEAARFEMRYGHKNRPGRGSSKLTSKYEDEVLNQILGNDGSESSSSRQQSNANMVSSICMSTTLDGTTLDGPGEISRSDSVDEPNHVNDEVGSTSPEELRQRALDEKKNYKILKGKGKSGEALKAFKRGKELERQADALEMSIRKNRRKALPSGNTADIQDKDGPKESSRKNRVLASPSQEKDDLTAELRELGWSDMDPHDENKKSAHMSLEGELSSLLGDISGRTNNDMGTCGIDKTQVVAHKRKALALKREGKLAEAKEELKKAKVLEKQLEEQELLGVAEDSDDEISALIRSMDGNKKDELLVGYEQGHGFDFDHFMVTADDIGDDSNFEVTDEDLIDPEIASTLKSLGWTDDLENSVPESVPIDREALVNEILSLKRDALDKKRAGNATEAMALLKKAKLLERDLESLGESDSLIAHNPAIIRKGSASQNVNEINDVDSKLAAKSRLVIQKELLALKKKALALRREGRLDEAEAELKKGMVLEQQLEEMENASKVQARQVTVASKDADLAHEHPDLSENPPVEDGEEDVTDQDMHDPTYVSLLRNLGWNDEDNEFANPPSQAISHVTARESKRSKAEIQRELLGLKRKALSLRREGMTDKADEVLREAKTLEAQMAKMEAPKKEFQAESNVPKDEIIRPLRSAKEGDVENVTENDMHDPALLSMLSNLGWNDEDLEPVAEGKSSKKVSVALVHSTDQTVIPSSSSILTAMPRSKGEIQRELLALKRKALALRRSGENEEAETLLKMAKVLETQMEDLEGPKKDLMPHISPGITSGSSLSLNNTKKQGNLINMVDMSEKLPVMAASPNDEVVKSLMDSGRKESDAQMRSSDNLMPVSVKLDENGYPLLGELHPLGETGFLDSAGTSQGTGFIPPVDHSVNTMDLLTGEEWRSSQTPAENIQETVNFGFDVSCPPGPDAQIGSSIPSRSLGSKEDVTIKMREELVNADKKQHTRETTSGQGLESQNSQNSLRQEVLVRKRKAVALKREGKLVEAREELRQAKLLEKSLDEHTPKPQTVSHDVPASVSDVPPVQQKEHGASNVAPKQLSGRDRFKLQQESLSHKRQALKLRREGRMADAEAEFELAKALEAQLEESTSQDSTNSSVNVAEPVDDIVVEDLLDPQLLSALKAIGIEGANVASKVPERPAPVKVVNPGRNDSVSQERIQLEERIKAEKAKAVNLKRSGKQAEALEALRRVKLFEKKLNSLASN